MKQVLSCIQPTGKLHLGRYFGAVKNWVDLQSEYDCIYGVVDLHAMTMPYTPKKLREASWELIYNLIASGIKKENIFVQSMIPEHAELAWILGTVCSYGELSRMTQFKDKTQQVKDTDKDAFVSAGLFTYPVLQAADILIYNADFVPVGKDQEQHLELTRNIAQRFNHVVGKEYFVSPETLFTEVPKVMSTADPTIKMSASKGEKHFIDLFGDDARIIKQIKSAVTDAGDQAPGTMSPGIENLFSLLKACGGANYEALLESYNKGELRYGDFKMEVAQAVVDLVKPMRERLEEIKANKKDIKYAIKQSTAEIRKKAMKTLSEVKELTGIMQTAKNI